MRRTPICFIIEELQRFTPKEPEKYQEYVAQKFANDLITMRNNECIAIANTQNLSMVDPVVRSSFNRHFMMYTKSDGDLRLFSRIYNIPTDIINNITSLNKSEAIINQKGYYNYIFNVVPPSHGHKEPRDKFFDLYKIHYAESIKEYKEIIKIMKEKKELSNNNKDVLWKEFLSKQHEIKESRSKSKQKIDELEKEIQYMKKENISKETLSKDALKKLCFEDYLKGMSLREIGTKRLSAMRVH